VTVPYGLSTDVALPFEEAVARSREELAKEGFGVLTEIDVRETLKKKLGVDFRPYVILGACQPPLAHEALEAELEVGLLLPCNVAVWETGPGTSVVAAFDPMVMTTLAQRPEAIRPIAEKVREKMSRVIQRLAAARAAS
jgi:uncharacterized protein (DUF302 family)